MKKHKAISAPGATYISESRAAAIPKPVKYVHRNEAIGSKRRKGDGISTQSKPKTAPATAGRNTKYRLPPMKIPYMNDRTTTANEYKIIIEKFGLLRGSVLKNLFIYMTILFTRSAMLCAVLQCKISARFLPKSTKLAV